MRFFEESNYGRLLGSPKLLMAFIAILVMGVSVAVVNITVCADTPQKASHKITIIADGAEFQYATTGATALAALKEAGIVVGEKDELYPSAHEPAYDKMRIRVVRVTEKTVTEKEIIKFRTVMKMDLYGTGERVVRRKGENGEKEVQRLQIYRDGIKSETKVIGERITKKPVNEEVTITKHEFLSSRSGSYTPSFEMVATGYDPMCCGPRSTGRTASGSRAGRGLVAVDPRVIPLGTKLFIDGYGFCIAADKGSAIRGNRIDLCFDSHSEACHYGRHRVKVYILD